MCQHLSKLKSVNVIKNILYILTHTHKKKKNFRKHRVEKNILNLIENTKKILQFILYFP